MGSFETGTDSAGELYGWVAERQHQLSVAAGQDHEEMAPVQTVGAADGTFAETEVESVTESEPLADRLPMAAKAFGVISRLVRHESYVPDNDRQALIGGKSATADSATLTVLEVVGSTPQAQAEPVRAEGQTSPGVVAWATRGVRRRVTRHREAQAERAERTRRRNDEVDLGILMRLHAGEPGKALEIMEIGQKSDDALVENAAILAAYHDDPIGLAAALAKSREPDADQLRRMQPHQVDQEQGALRNEWARRRSEGSGLNASDAGRYAAFERLRAARTFDESGAVADEDMRAEREAALAEAEERNRPDGKVLIVTDENITTPGLVGPLAALAGAAEVHTAGVPYHQFTRDFLEGVTGSQFREQLPFNDINQQYGLIILQGAFPPIKPTELVTQVGGRAGDMGIIPGDVDETFVGELRALIDEPQSTYFGRFTLVERPSRLVLVHPSPDGTPMATVQHEYERPTYLLVRMDSRTADDPQASSGGTVAA